MKKLRILGLVSIILATLLMVPGISQAVNSLRNDIGRIVNNQTAITPASGDKTLLWDVSAGTLGWSTITNAVDGVGTLASLTVTSITGGGGTFAGFIQSQVASTTTAATLAQCGSTFVSNSADVITLPEASTALGCRYTFVCGTADDFDVNPADATDVIGPISTTNGSTAVVTLAPSAGDAIRCTDIGGSVTLEAVGANLWAQVGGGNGIWTDVN